MFGLKEILLALSVIVIVLSIWGLYYFILGSIIKWRIWNVEELSDTTTPPLIMSVDIWEKLPKSHEVMTVYEQYYGVGE